MFLNLTLASGHTSPIIASGILNPALVYFLCSRALHVKCRYLPEDIISSPNIGTFTFVLGTTLNCLFDDSSTTTTPSRHDRHKKTDLYESIDSIRTQPPKVVSCMRTHTRCDAGPSLQPSLLYTNRPHYGTDD